jgi:hypothetical protein
MAFNREKFTSSLTQQYGKGMINEWRYITSDSGDAVASSDYFTDVQKSLAVGDIIETYYVQEDGDGNDTSFFRTRNLFCVRMSDDESGHIVALPISQLDGMGILKNTNGGDDGTIPMSDAHTVTKAYAILCGKVDSDGDSNTITVKNGATTLFTATIDGNTESGSLIAMEKNVDADEDLFSAESFDIENDGDANLAHGTVTVVLSSIVTPPEPEQQA